MLRVPIAIFALSAAALLNLAGCPTAVDPDDVALERLRPSCPSLPDEGIRSVITMMKAARQDGATSWDILSGINQCGTGVGDPAVVNECITCTTAVVDYVYGL